jgi:preprotein translocase SecE subunit
MKEKKETTGGFIQPVEKNEKSKPAKKAKKGPGFFKRLGGKFKDIFSELKKVSWPNFAKVVKKTGIVLAVVLIFLVVITAFDYGLLNLLKLVSPK